MRASSSAGDVRVKLEPTGERMIVEEYLQTPERYLIHLFHLATYRFAEAHTRERDVLDYGCGSGYGSARIAASARSVVAVDVAPDAVQYAREHYARSGAEFLHVDAARGLPFESERFDTVLSFQVIEHVPEPDAYLAEIARVLRPGGTLLVATPDRRTRLFPLQRPWNRYHVLEHDERSLGRLLARHFARVELSSMGAREDVVALELRRTRTLKWLTLPVTLPFVPERVRVGALGLLQWMRSARPRPAAAPATQALPIDRDDVHIGPSVRPSVNLIAIASVPRARNP